MRAIVIRSHGGPEVLSYEEVNDPRPLKGHAIVQVNYCAVNHLDIWVRNGLAGKQVAFPHILGCDISGTLAEGFGRFKKGESVVIYPAVQSGVPRVSFSIIGGFGRYQGGYAQMVQVPRENIVKKPSWFTDEEACALNVSYLTAWNMLQRSGCKNGGTILIWGANSGVGSAAIILAKAMGLRIITVVSSNEGASAATKLGASHVIDRKRTDVAAETLRYTNDKGVDAVIDHVGAKTWPVSIEVLKTGGRLVACGTTSGAEATVNIRAFYSKEATIVGAYLGSRSQLVSLHKFMKSKRIRPLIDSIFELRDARAAQQKMEQGSQFGKILLKVSS